MIHTSRQLKALVRNRSNGNSTKAQIIIRNYIMERFLERLSLSEHRNNLILKGGALISAIVGLETRTTMDIDTTLRNRTLSVDEARGIVLEVASVVIADGISFELLSVETIMDEAEYPGVRAILNASLESMQTPLKVDFSTGDAITPREMNYAYPLMFENRTISLLAYNLETVVAEKLETILSRGITNTRMRDYYDIYVLCSMDSILIDNEILATALLNTCRKRGSTWVVKGAELVLAEISGNQELKALWTRYQARFDYANTISWADVILAVVEMSYRSHLLRNDEAARTQ